MGLFSSSKKNKHDKLAQNLGQDPGHFSRAEDEAIGEKARAKRASHAAGAAGRKDVPDPVLPEKKRARRRLVGAIALALAAIIGIPMLLDSEPKPLSGDIAIQIPSKEKAAPLPVPAAPAPVDAADTLDKREEIVTAPSKPEAPRKVSKYDTELRDEPAPAKVEPKPEPKPKPEAKVAKADKPEKPVKADKPKPARPEEKRDGHPLAVKSDEQSRALAILEDKEDKAAKPAKVERDLADNGSQRFVLQVVALASQDKVTELQARLAGAGLRSYTEKSTSASGAQVIRVRVGPFGKDDAERTRAKLSAMGLPGTMVPTK